LLLPFDRLPLLLPLLREEDLEEFLSLLPLEELPRDF
jgi:hypothetical protein